MRLRGDVRRNQAGIFEPPSRIMQTMLRMVQNNDAAGAKRYYTEGLANGDYYVPEPDPRAGSETAGRWGGKGAERLGLTGPVERDAFNRLCENWLPDGTARLTPRTKADRRVGYDINFHCPKSVSVLYALTGDKAIFHAFQEAVRETMVAIEAEARTRVRLAGADGDRLTGNLVWAEFTHTTSRPVAGIPDPHLHAHCFTFNATYDLVENRWKAAEFGGVKRDGAYFEAMFHSRLAYGLAQSGYEIQRRGFFWEVKGISDAVIERFSKRSTEIDAVAKRLEITDPDEKAALGAKTRRAKSEAKPWSAVIADWESRLSPDERMAVHAAKGDGPAALQTTKDGTTGALNEAFRRCFERAALVREKQVLEEALRLGVGWLTPQELSREFARYEVVRREVNGERFVTTPRALAEEGLMLDFAKGGRGTCFPILKEVNAAVSNQLAPQDRRLVETVLTSPDRVIFLRGGRKVNEAQVAAAALGAMSFAGLPTVELIAASRGARRKESSSESRKAQTVSAFLESKDIKSELKEGVIWINGAGKLGFSHLADVFRAAEKHGARVVLFGNARWQDRGTQGDLLRLLETHAGLRMEERSESRRNNAERRGVLEALSKGEHVKAFSKLDKLGGVYEAKAAEFRDSIASEFAKAVRGKKSALVVAENDHAEITATVRSKLQGLRLLGKSRSFEKLERIGLGDAERSDPSIYEPGQVVAFFKNAKGFRKGHRYEVVGRDPFGNVLAREGAWIEALPLKRSSDFALFRRGTIELAKGESIRITSTGRTKNETFGMEKLLSDRQQAVRLENYRLFGIQAPDRRYRVPRNSIHRIAGFTLHGDIKLENGWVLPKNFGHLDYGYCVSSQAPKECAAQHLIVARPSEPSDRRYSELGFVGLAERKPQTITVVTDDKTTFGARLQRNDDVAHQDTRETPPHEAEDLSPTLEHQNVNRAAERDHAVNR